MTEGRQAHSLLDAVAALGSDLDLHSTLHRIIKTACDLVGAEFGALGVLAADEQTLSDFITFGIADNVRQRIGPLPKGHGILGVLIRSPEPLRLHNIAADPRSYGFPANHPPMRSFLGVPLRTHSQVFGNLYLTEKEGGDDFSDEDEAIVVALAAAAGVAIENARLYEQSSQRQRWLEAAAEITDAVLGDLDRTQSLQLIASRARTLASADVAAIVLVENGNMHVEVVDTIKGVTAGVEVGQFVTGGVAEQVGRSGRPVIVTASGSEQPQHQEVRNSLGLISGMFVPMSSATGMLGVLAVGNLPGRPARYTNEELAVAGTFAGQATLALERAISRESIAQLAVFEDRDRIARDLHDLVIQRLFATGLSLQGTLRQIKDADALARVKTAVDDLDETIREVRSSIFELHGYEDDGDNLLAGLHRVIVEFETSFDAKPTLRTSGPVNTGVPDKISEHLVAVLTESLSNAARHGHASHAWANLTVGVDVVLEVTDDGTGYEASDRESGLQNLQERAKEMGGKFSITARDGGGTTVCWTAPANAAD